VGGLIALLACVGAGFFIWRRRAARERVSDIDNDKGTLESGGDGLPIWSAWKTHAPPAQVPGGGEIASASTSTNAHAVPPAADLRVAEEQAGPVVRDQLSTSGMTEGAPQTYHVSWAGSASGHSHDPKNHIMQDNDEFDPYAEVVD
jgi:hypothetical protein